MAKGKGKDKGVTGKASSDKDKDKGKGKPKTGLDVQGLIFDWFVGNFDGVVKYDKNNGIVSMGKVGTRHVKAVKIPTFENKGGLFYGAVLNGQLAKVKGCVHHAKSNVYKHGAGITVPQVKAIRQALVNTFDGYKGGQGGLVKGLPMDKAPKAIDKGQADQDKATMDNAQA